MDNAYFTYINNVNLYHIFYINNVKVKENSGQKFDIVYIFVSRKRIIFSLYNSMHFLTYGLSKNRYMSPNLQNVKNKLDSTDQERVGTVTL